ncbi:hypothetical protein DWX23_11330 [Parabacteroides sp. AF18-52]|nr:hypothetical protein DWX23_11330 [Parabacteroides sp. AF18-52]
MNLKVPYFEIKSPLFKTQKSGLNISKDRYFIQSLLIDGPVLIQLTLTSPLFPSPGMEKLFLHYKRKAHLFIM